MSKKLFVHLSFLTILFSFFANCIIAQSQVMTPELLWKLGRVSGEAVSPDGKTIIYGITNYDIQKNKGERNLYSISLPAASTGKLKNSLTASTVSVQITDSIGTESGVQFLAGNRIGYIYKDQWWEADITGKNAKQISNIAGGISVGKVSPDGKYFLYAHDVKIDQTSLEKYPDLPKTSGEVYDDLMYRHWNSYEDGFYSHIFWTNYSSGTISNEAKDIMSGVRYNCPQAPMGGAEDVQWSADGKKIFYVCKKKAGKKYALSTNSDLYVYDLTNGVTSNFTDGLNGYDTNPVVSPDGTKIIWLSMARDGYEADKNRIMLYDFTNNQRIDLTNNWDETVSSIVWSTDGKKIFFTETFQATEQIFEITLPPVIADISIKNFRQVTNGDWDVNGIVGVTANSIIVSRCDMNHASEIFKVDIATGSFFPLTIVNKSIYDNLSMGKIEKRWIKTTDKKQELVWVIYPPNFDPAKKYATLLYCQGGPQSPVSQFYSFRWNFQLMAANNYIVVAPNRRGLPGFGTKWNEDISKDWGGQAMDDYLSAIDSIAKLPFVDKSRVGCIGASYGGYSVYMLAGIHGGRFKTFISHCGVFDLQSMYLTTEEMWFADWDMGGNFWQSKVPVTYTKFNPINYADKWNTPIMVIHNDLDFRVPLNQGMEAFQLAQLKGIKSRFLRFPDEGHWVMKPQNGLLWQREFYSWLDDTLNPKPDEE